MDYMHACRFMQNTLDTSSSTNDMKQIKEIITLTPPNYKLFKNL